METRFLARSQGWCVLVVAWLAMAAMGADVPRREHIILPPSYVGTPLSAVISAQAQYIAAQGDFLESVAIARKIHAEAAAQEIENSIYYVEAYFERRRLNREARLREDPNYLMREKRRQDILKQQIAEQYQALSKLGDLSRILNWLLQELSGPTVAYEYLGRSGLELDLLKHQTLSPRDLSLIWLTDGGKGRSRLVFRAADGMPMQKPWPFALRAPQFEAARAEFEKARETVLQELRGGSPVSHETAQKLFQAVNDLLVLLAEAYPDEIRADPNQFLEYSAARRYLQSMLAEANRATHTTDTSLFQQALAFKGENVLELVRHMNRSGLLFAPAEEGGEGVYRRLFDDLRDIYLTVGSERGKAGAGKGPPANPAPARPAFGGAPKRAPRPPAAEGRSGEGP